MRPSMRRAKCPVCKRDTAVNGAGKFMPHMVKGKPGQGQVLCPGSNRDAGQW